MYDIRIVKRQFHSSVVPLSKLGRAWIYQHMNWVASPHSYIRVDTETIDELRIRMEHDKLNVEVV
jgi:hypothetical protein